jgi:hypothetical protein
MNQAFNEIQLLSESILKEKKMSSYYFAIVGATDNPIYETEIVPSSRSSAFIEPNRVKLYIKNVQFIPLNPYIIL